MLFRNSAPSGCVNLDLHCVYNLPCVRDSMRRYDCAQQSYLVAIVPAFPLLFSRDLHDGVLLKVTSFYVER